MSNTVNIFSKYRNGEETFQIDPSPEGERIKEKERIHMEETSEVMSLLLLKRIERRSLHQGEVYHDTPLSNQLQVIPVMLAPMKW